MNKDALLLSPCFRGEGEPFIFLLILAFALILCFCFLILSFSRSSSRVIFARYLFCLSELVKGRLSVSTDWSSIFRSLSRNKVLRFRFLILSFSRSSSRVIFARYLFCLSELVKGRLSVSTD
uniref:Uncharacterized protein n=1 Tax=Cacopsylla melanoneura TaxID=428564 RepID=A0A8D8Q857_9HEMI